MNEAKSLAREDAVSFYPLGDVANSFFVYKKDKRRYDVICYALLRTSSRSSGSVRNPSGAPSAFERAEKASKDAEDKIRKLTEENELLKKASDFSGMDEKTLTEVFKKVAPALEKFGYKVSLTKEAVSN